MADFGVVSGQVTQQFGTANDYAAQTFETAMDAIRDLVPVFGFELPYSQLAYNFPEITLEDYIPDPIDKPDIDIKMPDKIDPVMVDKVIVEMVDLPDFSAEKPTINIPENPNPTKPSELDGAPTVADVELPVKPSFVMPTAPNLQDFSLPTSPGFLNPQFEGIMPIDNLTAPTSVFAYNEGVYQSDLADALTAKLLSDLESGGTGLEASVEEALLARKTITPFNSHGSPSLPIGFSLIKV